MFIISMLNLSKNIASVEDEILSACQEYGRLRNDVKLVAVSKTVDFATVAKANNLGLCDFGENRSDVFLDKFNQNPNLNWHFIGRLQSRKARDVVGRACLIHSLDRISLMNAIEKEASKQNIVQSVLVQLNISKEASKAGLDESQLDEFLQMLCACSHIKVCGLMTIAPFGDLLTAEKCFERLCFIREKYKEKYKSVSNIDLCELSCGMTQDFDLAIKHQSTIVRIGRKIFSS
ncbi:MAG: YggS family pyridoxal phosphate-dependent enzyme [Coriobacteriales bacterium]|nr:YggS family pyridoxal phosphate-dependent enzyme [Coriobacteriales bacterium]